MMRRHRRPPPSPYTTSRGYLYDADGDMIAQDIDVRAAPMLAAAPLMRDALGDVEAAWLSRDSDALERAILAASRVLLALVKAEQEG